VVLAVVVSTHFLSELEEKQPIRLEINSVACRSWPMAAAIRLGQKLIKTKSASRDSSARYRLVDFELAPER